MTLSAGSFVLGSLFGILVMGIIWKSQPTPDTELKDLQLEHARLEVEISKRINARLADSTDTVVAIQIED